MTGTRGKDKKANARAEERPARPPRATATDANDIAAGDDVLITLSQAGEIIGISRQSIHRHVVAGKIQTKQIRCRLYVTVGEAKRFKSLERRGGRPLKDPDAVEPPPKRPRGRPRKETPPPPKRPRGRPRTRPLPLALQPERPKRGRPPKNV